MGPRECRSNVGNGALVNCKERGKWGLGEFEGSVGSKNSVSFRGCGKHHPISQRPNCWKIR